MAKIIKNFTDFYGCAKEQWINVVWLVLHDQVPLCSLWSRVGNIDVSSLTSSATVKLDCFTVPAGWL